ncbi:hypothetical protein PR048_004479 [Dryococelus australis]|uniref:Uncharacterized protein n=1 Tax=Dryococelus australis TaxID=614101 RepID=A0ABQ9I5K9_9NEOP|nr:hypothetical protein PR048_004479 [Dryococelus australis]
MLPLHVLNSPLTKFYRLLKGRLHSQREVTWECWTSTLLALKCDGNLNLLTPDLRAAYRMDLAFLGEQANVATQRQHLLRPLSSSSYHTVLSNFGGPGFPEITPGECWDGSLTKAMADSFTFLSLFRFPVQLAPPLMTSLSPRPWGHGDVVVRLLASHLGGSGSIPGGVAPGFLHVGIVPDDAAGRRVFSGISFIPAIAFQRYSILISLCPHRLSKTSILITAHIPFTSLPHCLILIPLWGSSGAVARRSPPTTAIRARSQVPDPCMWEPHDHAFQRRSILEPYLMSCPGMTGIYWSWLESPSCSERCLALSSDVANELRYEELLQGKYKFQEIISSVLRFFTLPQTLWRQLVTDRLTLERRKRTHYCIDARSPHTLLSPPLDALLARGFTLFAHLELKGNSARKPPSDARSPSLFAPSTAWPWRDRRRGVEAYLHAGRARVSDSSPLVAGSDPTSFATSGPPEVGDRVL